MRRLFDKLFNKKKYYNDKYSLKMQKDKLNFKNNFENQINKIQSTTCFKKRNFFFTFRPYWRYYKYFTYFKRNFKKK